MKVFVDANILLDIYELSGSDLEELHKLKRMVDARRLELLVTDQVLDEFWRNRERVVGKVLTTFAMCKADVRIPNIIRSYEKAASLTTMVRDVNAAVKDLHADVRLDVETDNLQADEVIKDLLSVANTLTATDQHYERARLRAELGNPPGKRTNCIGDAVSWEILLGQDAAFWDSSFVLISSDGDFESELTKAQPREFLVREWGRRFAECRLELQTSLPAFFNAHFPNILLAEDVEKVNAIDALESSPMFAVTHQAIKHLDKYEQFRKREVERLLDAYLKNDQVYRILDDHDVFKFAHKVVKAGYDHGLAAKAEELRDDLLEVARDEARREAEDELPF